MGDNYIDNHIDEIRAEFKLLDHWIYLNAADQMIPGKYWLDAVRDFCYTTSPKSYLALK